jgi:hypothetical protein
MIIKIGLEYSREYSCKNLSGITKNAHRWEFWGEYSNPKKYQKTWKIPNYSKIMCGQLKET